MNEFNVEVLSGSSVRLPTAGKYCEADIIVTSPGEDPINNQDLTITENGTYTADEGYTGLGTVTVDVQGGGGGNFDAIWEVDGTTPTEVHSNATSIRPYVFQECPAITVADFPKATSMGEKAFYNSGVIVANFPELLIVPKNAFANCRNLKSANFQKAETIESSAFDYCNVLESIELPEVTKLNADALSDCRKLKRVVLPKVTTLSGYNIMSNCFNLLVVDFHSYAGSFDSQLFYNDYSLKAIILRSETMVTLANASSVFANCYHMSGTYNATYNPYSYKDGVILVPRSIIDTYRKTTNWSQYGTQFRVLEDVTVDGPIMGELDPTKIII